jgi:hypothetical protein
MDQSQTRRFLRLFLNQYSEHLGATHRAFRISEHKAGACCVGYSAMSLGKPCLQPPSVLTCVAFVHDIARIEQLMARSSSQLAPSPRRPQKKQGLFLAWVGSIFLSCSRHESSGRHIGHGGSFLPT